MTIVTAAATIMLGLAAALCLFRLYRGPSALDRILAIDVLLVIFIAGVALESVWNHRATNLPLIMVLAMVNFVGGVAVTRLLSRDSDEQPSDSDGVVSSWSSVLDTAGGVCLLLGAASASQGLSGLVRFPDTLSRLHAVTKPQSLGLVLVLGGLALTLRSWAATTTLLIAAAAQFFTSPVSAHLVGRTATGTGAWTTATWTSTSCPRPSSVATEPDDN